MRRQRTVPFALMLMFVAAGAWGTSRAMGSAAPPADLPAPRIIQIPAPRPVSGSLTPEARKILAEHMGAGPLVLVALHGRDWLTCEDLGRQLRELQHRNQELKFVIATDSVDGLGAFLRRERLRWPVLALTPADVVEGYPALPTPAVLSVRDGGRRIEGVAHPERVANARVRSFADEMADLLR